MLIETGGKKSRNKSGAYWPIGRPFEARTAVGGEDLEHPRGGRGGSGKSENKPVGSVEVVESRNRELTNQDVAGPAADPGLLTGTIKSIRDDPASWTATQTPVPIGKDDCGERLLSALELLEQLWGSKPPSLRWLRGL